MSNYIKNTIVLSAFVVVGFFIGAYIPNNDTRNDLSSNYSKIREILTHIDRDYVDSVDLNDLTDYAIKKMLEKLDPHSVYIPPEEVEMAQSQLRGDFEGIGVEFNILRDTLYVVTPLSGGPSEKVGIRAGDRIVKVNGKNLAGIGLKNSDVYESLRGDKGTKVEMEIKRPGKKKLLEFTVIRDKIPTFAVDASYMIDSKTGYLKLNRFSATAYDEFKTGLDKLKEKGMQHLILDLRDNPGGYLDKAVKIADEFLSGKKLIVYTKSKSGKYDDEIDSRRVGEFESGALIVLINEGSASASEIVSGALQDHDRALIVGRRSFGKGLVQQPIPLNNKGELRLTISRYYIPSGRSIQKTYENGVGDYRKDFQKRVERGEMFHEDSVELADSLVYVTSGGRKVYGGGGIMPDVFVPRDTSNWSQLINDLYSTNIIREFSYDWVERNRKDIEKNGLDSYIKDFEMDDKIMSELLEKAKNNGVEVKEEDLAISEKSIKIQLKALIGRNIWGAEGFYPIYQAEDEILQAALQNIEMAIGFAKTE
jgi:carboxyl-terminal processing protease